MSNLHRIVIVGGGAGGLLAGCLSSIPDCTAVTVTVGAGTAGVRYLYCASTGAGDSDRWCRVGRGQVSVLYLQRGWTQ